MSETYTFRIRSLDGKFEPRYSRADPGRGPDEMRIWDTLWRKFGGRIVIERRTPDGWKPCSAITSKGALTCSAAPGWAAMIL